MRYLLTCSYTKEHGLQDVRQRLVMCKRGPFSCDDTILRPSSCHCRVSLGFRLWIEVAVLDDSFRWRHLRAFKSTFWDFDQWELLKRNKTEPKTSYLNPRFHQGILKSVTVRTICIAIPVYTFRRVKEKYEWNPKPFNNELVNIQDKYSSSSGKLSH